MYNRDTKSATALLDTLVEQNKEKFSSDTNKSILGARRLIDIQCKIASYFMPFWTSPGWYAIKGREGLNPLLLTSFHKNIYSSYATLVLTAMGLYGPSRPILRGIFETLMIAKFCHTSEDVKVLQRWHEIETIYFTNSVLKKIVVPDPQPFTELWNLLCETSHATRTAGQISMNTEEDFQESFNSLAILNALLECNYHLLNSVLITPAFSYMVRFYNTRFALKKKRGYKIPELRKSAHRQFVENRSFLGRESIRVITAYKRKWVLGK
jgi:hypothetical protein